MWPTKHTDKIELTQQFDGISDQRYHVVFKKVSIGSIGVAY